ncbi:MAG: hypothetical protein WCF27_13080 [Gaiellaceae bacterium]
MHPSTVIALGLALASTVLINIAYLIEHDAAAALPVLTIRRPVQSVRALLSDRSWLLGFGLESVGFLLYVGALRLASLALVQSVAAGGIGLLAFVSSRINRRPLGSRERSGVLLSMFGLVVLAVSLVGGSGEGGAGSTVAIVIWLAATAALAVSAVTLGRRMLGVAVAEGVAGGLFFSLGDVSTKVATQGGARFVFVAPLIIGYTLGTWLLQLGYQRGGALTVAGLATLLTNAVPIAASMLVLGEPVPSGAYGALRVLAFAAVTIGAILLARPDRKPAT